jgi:hypothetical protein
MYIYVAPHGDFPAPASATLSEIPHLAWSTTPVEHLHAMIPSRSAASRPGLSVLRLSRHHKGANSRLDRVTKDFSPWPGYFSPADLRPYRRCWTMNPSFGHRKRQHEPPNPTKNGCKGRGNGSKNRKKDRWRNEAKPGFLIFSIRPLSAVALAFSAVSTPVGLLLELRSNREGT